MGKLIRISPSIYRKKVTGADYNRPSGILNDTQVIVTASMAASRIVPIGFMYDPGIHQLEVYVNGVYKRANEDGATGDYDEYSRSSVQFDPGQISISDRVRFRVTSAYYKNKSYQSQLDGEVCTSRYTITAPGDWVSDSGNYSYTINHDFGVQYLSVMCYDTSTDKQVIPLDIEAVDSDNLKIWMPVNTVSMVVVIAR